MDNEHYTLTDRSFMDSAGLIAHGALVKHRNLPIGCVLVLDNSVIATGENHVIKPEYNPGRHAALEAIHSIPVDMLVRAKEMTLYTTVEPCIMCMSTLITFGIGRVVYGARDWRCGGTSILKSLPDCYRSTRTIEVIGPVDSEKYDKYYGLAQRMLNTALESAKDQGGTP